MADTLLLATIHTPDLPPASHEGLRLLTVEREYDRWARLSTRESLVLGTGRKRPMRYSRRRGPGVCGALSAVGRFLHQGQDCMSTNRIIVHARVYDEFVDRFVTHVKSLKYGNPEDPTVAIGSVINQKRLDGHLNHIEGALSAGARQVVGGPPEGLVLPPCLP